MATTKLTMATVTATVTEFCEEGEWWKTDGVEDEDVVAAYQAKGIGSYANSKHNLAQEDTYDLIDTGHVPDWDDTNGWKFDGSVQGLLTPSISNITDEFSGIIRFSNLGSIIMIGYDLLSHSEENYCFRIFAGSSLEIFGSIDNDSVSAGYLGADNGIAALTKTGIYINGILINDVWSPSSFSISGVIGIGCTEDIEYVCRGYIQALAIYNKTLTPTQIAAITDNMEAL